MLFNRVVFKGGWTSNEDLLAALNNAYLGHIRGKRQQVCRVRGGGREGHFSVQAAEKQNEKR